MKQTIILRNNPKLEIALEEDRFEVSDNSAPNNNGIYPYSNLKLVELNKDWFRSIVKYIPGFFMISAFGSNLKNRANLKITLDKQILKLRLVNANMKKAKTVTQKLNDKKSTHNN